MKIYGLGDFPALWKPFLGSELIQIKFLFTLLWNYNFFFKIYSGSTHRKKNKPVQLNINITIKNALL